MFNLVTGIILVQVVVAAIAAIAVRKENYHVAKWMACGFFIIAAAVGTVSVIQFLRADFPGPQMWWIRAAATTAISVGLVLGIFKTIRWVLALGAVYLFVAGVGYSFLTWVQGGFRFGSFQIGLILEPFHIRLFLIPILMNLVMAWVLWRMFRWASGGGSTS